MSFQEGGQFKGGRVQRAGGGRTAALTGGGLGVVALALISYFIFGNPDVLSGLAGGTGSDQPATAPTGYVSACSADQANTDPQCRLNATVQALDAYWTTALPAQGRVQYIPPNVVSYDGSTQSSCGTASNAVGPFYCPVDQTIYIDVTFFNELTGQLGASGGALGEEYVVAHEMGHHIQDQLGTLAAHSSNAEGASSDSVRLELQADCYAGMWAGQAASTIDPDTGTTFLAPITQDELESALSAAAAVGDDHIQKSQTGSVQPESFTHGTSAQRVKWFTIGYSQNNLSACDTFNTPTL